MKSLREGGVQLKDAYAEVRDGEVWLRNMHIAPYKPARENHDPERPRKLLLHRREIERLLGATSEKGLTIVPTRLYWNGPRAKVELAVAKGKDLYDKRRAIKERDTKREIQRAMSEAGGGLGRTVGCIGGGSRPGGHTATRPVALQAQTALRRPALSSWRLESWSLRRTEDRGLDGLAGDVEAERDLLVRGLERCAGAPRARGG